MSDSPIFDQMVKDFQMRTGRSFASLCTKTKDGSIRTNPNFIPRDSRPAFPPQSEEDTMQIHVVPLSHLQSRNVA